MNLQPYKVTIINQTPEQLSVILNNSTEQDFNMIKDLFLPNFGIDAVTDLFMASPETFTQLLKYYQKLGIDVKYSVKKGKDFLYSNQQQINQDATPEFICASVQYIVDHCTQDDVYNKLNCGDKHITPADHYLLENQIN